MASIYKRLADLLAALEDDIQVAFLESIQGITDDAILEQLIDAIEAGDYRRAYAGLGIMPGSLNPFITALETAYRHSAEFVVQGYPTHVQTSNGKVKFHFNMRDPRAEQWLRDKSSQMVTLISEDARINVQSTLQRGMIEGRNPRDTALDIVGRYNRTTGHREGGVIGLTKEQGEWVGSARQRLTQAHLGGEAGDRYLSMGLRDKRFDSVVEKAMATGKPLTKAQVENLTTRYSSRTLKYRGDTISQHESMSAFNTADYDSAKQVVALGAAREKDVERVWDDAGDNRVRHSHKELDGQRVGLDEPFESPVSGARMMYPTDTSLDAPTKETLGCRCRARINIDWLGAFVND